jgi:hypothetical protein
MARYATTLSTMTLTMKTRNIIILITMVLIAKLGRTFYQFLSLCLVTLCLGQSYKPFFDVIYVTSGVFSCDFDLDYADSDVIMSKRGFIIFGADWTENSY